MIAHDGDNQATPSAPDVDERGRCACVGGLPQRIAPRLRRRAAPRRARAGSARARSGPPAGLRPGRPRRRPQARRTAGCRGGTSGGADMIRPRTPSGTSAWRLLVRTGKHSENPKPIRPPATRRGPGRGAAIVTIRPRPWSSSPARARSRDRPERRSGTKASRAIAEPTLWADDQEARAALRLAERLGEGRRQRPHDLERRAAGDDPEQERRDPRCDRMYGDGADPDARSIGPPGPPGRAGEPAGDAPPPQVRASPHRREVA